jgi:hypothetical protein
MTEMTDTPIPYVRTCPLCEQGRCRVRVGEADDRIFSCVVCDECEATWSDPGMRQRFPQPSAEQPTFPYHRSSLWGPGTRWADTADLCLLGAYSMRFTG